VPVFAASTLLALSADNAARARTLLERAAKAPARDGFERLVQDNGRTILDALAAGDVARARETAKRLSPLGTVR
jgi:DNA-binding GntR family transcriptional regulator